MNPEPESIHRPITGTLLLVDLCGSTSGQSEHGSVPFAKFQRGVKKPIESFEQATGFRLMQEAGDGFMLFRKAVEPNESVDELQTFFSELEGRAPQLATAQFRCALRYVAHYGPFLAEPDPEGYPQNIQTTEAVRVFRAEKLASVGDLLVTRDLRLRLPDCPERRACSVETLRLDRPLKGLELLGDATTIFYRIRLARQKAAADRLFPEVYRKRRRELGESCKMIPVFGRVFDPIPMDENFMELSLDPVSRRATAEDDADWQHRGSEMSRGGRKAQIDDTGDELDLDSGDRIKASKLCESYPHGVILGLPGTGKTTILRYLVHRTLRRDEAAPILFAACGDMLDRHRDLCPPDAGDGSYTRQGALRLLLALFVWSGDLIQGADPFQLRKLSELFAAAWDAHEATVLVDALDEARSKPLRQTLILALRALFNALPPNRRSSPRTLNVRGFSVLRVVNTGIPCG